MYITEEAAEIASQYFYEMGLNSDGIRILAEELGQEEFYNFVEDIICSYTITEAEAHQGELLTRDLKARKSPKITKAAGTSSPVKNRPPTSEKTKSSEQPSTSPGQLSLFNGATRTRSSRTTNPTKPARTSETRGVGFASSGRPKPPSRSTRGRVESNVRPTPPPTGTARSRRQARRSGLTADPWNLPFTPKPHQESTPKKQTEPQKLLPPARAKAVETAVQSQKPFGSETTKQIAGATLRALADAGKIAWSGHQRAMKEKKAGKTVSQQIGAGLRTMFLKPQYHENFELWVNALLDEGYDLSNYTWDDMLSIYEENISYMQEGNELYSKVISHLISEGYASTLEGAQVIAQNMSDDWIDKIIN
jgi:hypothetical protein